MLKWLLSEKETEKLSDWQSEDLKDLQELLSATRKRFTSPPLALVTTIGLGQFLQFICVERKFHW